MQRLITEHRRLLAVWLLWSCTVVSAFAFTQTSTIPGAWSSTPALSRDVTPSYQFHSTSALSLTVGDRSYLTGVYAPGAGTTTSSGPRKSGYWNSDGEWVEVEDPIGVIPDPAPLGEPLVLLVLALLYALVRKRKMDDGRRTMDDGLKCISR